MIYGTLATIPIFLLWLYLGWAVTLLGASLAASLTTFTDRQGDWRWPWEWELLLTYRLIGHLWKAQQSGRALSVEALNNAEPGVSSHVLQRLLADFIAAGIVLWFVAGPDGTVPLGAFPVLLYLGMGVFAIVTNITSWFLYSKDNPLAQGGAA